MLLFSQLKKPCRLIFFPERKGQSLKFPPLATRVHWSHVTEYASMIGFQVEHDWHQLTAYVTFCSEKKMTFLKKLLKRLYWDINLCFLSLIFLVYMFLTRKFNKVISVKEIAVKKSITVALSQLIRVQILQSSFPNMDSIPRGSLTDY